MYERWSRPFQLVAPSLISLSSGLLSKGSRSKLDLRETRLLVSIFLLIKGYAIFNSTLVKRQSYLTNWIWTNIKPINRGLSHNIGSCFLECRRSSTGWPLIQSSNQKPDLATRKPKEHTKQTKITKQQRSCLCRRNQVSNHKMTKWLHQRIKRNTCLIHSTNWKRNFSKQPRPDPQEWLCR